MSRVFRATYNNRNGQTQTAEGYYVEFKDHRARQHRLKGFTDERATKELLRKIEKIAARRMAGEQLDPELVTFLTGAPERIVRRLAEWDLLDSRALNARAPLLVHLDDYERALRDSGDSDEYVQKTVNRVKAILEGTGAEFLKQLDGAGVTGFLAQHRAKGLGIRSSNHYLAAIKGFCAWLVRERRASENPVAHLAAMNAQADRRHRRRPLEVDELRRLLSVTRGGPERSGMTGEERYWLYRLAAETGFRSNELRNLVRASFDLGSNDPVVTCDAAFAKNGRTRTNPLRPETAAELTGFLASKLPAAHVFRMPKPHKVVIMLRQDLAAAGIPYRDDAGRAADFHAFRVTFASQLLRAGVDIRTAKDLMGHATIAMTADVYACTMRGSMTEAMRRLPDFTTPAANEQRATGTDDSCLASCLAFQGTPQGATVHFGAPCEVDARELQPIGVSENYGESSRMKTPGEALCSPGLLPPPRGVEPLSSG